MSQYPFITLYSITLVLAYCQHYTCNFRPGRSLPDAHLQRLSAWIGQPVARLRSLRQHPLLSAHLALLQAAQLLAHNNVHWYLTPAAHEWLRLSPADQFAALDQAFAAVPPAAADLNVATVLPLDYIAYLQQQLCRQADATLPPAEAATWHMAGEMTWQLHLPAGLPLRLRFHLLQLGDWQPDEPLTLSPLTCARAGQRGYSLSHISYLLAKATGAPLPPAQTQQLLDWHRHAQALQLRPVTLLTVRRPELLAQIMGSGHLRPHIQQQITPRHALVSPSLLPLLHKWAARRFYWLDIPQPPAASAHISPTEYHWLGLHLLAALGQIMPLPYPPPTAELDSLSPAIPPAQQATLSSLADQIIQQLQGAINGRDAFFPADQLPSAGLVDHIQQAIEHSSQLTFSYLPLNATAPKEHTVEPLRLEQRGRLTYLYAYSYRAEANLIFRLDRVKEIVTESQDSTSQVL